VETTWKRLLASLSQHAPTVSATLRPGASEAALSEAEAALGTSLPVDVRASYSIHDGQEGKGAALLDGGFMLLPLATALAMREAFLADQDLEWADSLLPLTTNGRGEFDVVDSSDGSLSRYGRLFAEAPHGCGWGFDHPGQDRVRDAISIPFARYEAGLDVLVSRWTSVQGSGCDFNAEDFTDFLIDPKKVSQSSAHGETSLRWEVPGDGWVEARFEGENLEEDALGFQIERTEPAGEAPATLAALLGQVARSLNCGRWGFEDEFGVIARDRCWVLTFDQPLEKRERDLLKNRRNLYKRTRKSLKSVVKGFEPLVTPLAQAALGQVQPAINLIEGYLQAETSSTTVTMDGTTKTITRRPFEYPGLLALRALLRHAPAEAALPPLRR
jgi:cell wall assembly regulator SMI1